MSWLANEVTFVHTYTYICMYIAAEATLSATIAKAFVRDLDCWCSAKRSSEYHVSLGSI